MEATLHSQRGTQPPRRREKSTKCFSGQEGIERAEKENGEEFEQMARKGPEIEREKERIENERAEKYQAEREVADREWEEQESPWLNES